MLVWSGSRGGSQYELRSAGNSLRLYRNGVFHSQYNGARPLNGGVWDMLWLPLCARPRESIRSVLMLGVGCGAALKKIADYFPGVTLTGVDLDSQHLRLARRYIGLRGKNTRLHCADARKWLAATGAGRFDVIIDDLFADRDGVPERALPLDEDWCGLLRSRLAADGMLVANCVKAGEAKLLYRQGPLRLAHALQLREAGYDNRVIACSGLPLSARQIRSNYAVLVRAHWPGASTSLPNSLSMTRLTHN